MRAADEDHEPGHERWLVSYADFITLMFAFFAVLYATSQKDVEKTKKFEESVKRYLMKVGVMGGGQGGAAGGASTPMANQIDEQNSPIEPPINRYRQPNPEAVKSLSEAEVFVEGRFTPQERKTYILDLVADDWGVRLTLPSSALFADKSEKFREEALPFVSKLGLLFAQSQRKALIEGHVAVGETGAFNSTWDFASARAVNLLRFIQKKEGLPENKLAAASFGDSRPVYQGEKAARNSRVEIVLLNPDMEL